MGRNCYKIYETYTPLNEGVDAAKDTEETKQDIPENKPDKDINNVPTESEKKPDPPDPSEAKHLFSLSLTEKEPEFDPQEAKLKEPHTFTPRDLLTLLR